MTYQRMHSWRLGLLGSLLLVTGCFGADTSANSPTETSYAFDGLTSVSQNPDMSWTVSWVLVAGANLNYEVFSALEGAEFNYSKPLVATTASTYRTENLAFSQSTCFIVRLATGDKNVNKKCTGHKPFTKFTGLKKLTLQEDSGRYLLEWDRIPASNGNVYYSVYYKKKLDPTYDFKTPLQITRDSTFTTQLFERGSAYCFLTRFDYEPLGKDENTQELCSNLEPDLAYSYDCNTIVSEYDSMAGIYKIKLSWPPVVDASVAGYRVYIESSSVIGYIPRSTGTEPPAYSFFFQSVPGPNKLFNVKAVDRFGRESETDSRCPVSFAAP